MGMMQKESGNYYSILGLYRDNVNKTMEITMVCWSHMGILEKTMET